MNMYPYGEHNTALHHIAFRHNGKESFLNPQHTFEIPFMQGFLSEIAAPAR